MRIECFKKFLALKISFLTTALNVVLTDAIRPPLRQTFTATRVNGIVRNGKPQTSLALSLLTKFASAQCCTIALIQSDISGET